MGKSALARAVAAHFLRPEYLAEGSPFHDGLFVVDLADVLPAREASQEPQLLRQQIAQVIGGAVGIALDGAHEPVAELSNYLRSKSLLLVLDNIERLVEGRDLLSALLQAGLDLKLLATSRVRLQMAEKTVLELKGLEVPADETGLEHAPASQLFLQSARRSAANWVTAASDQRHIARICEILQGHPLALSSPGAGCERCRGVRSRQS
jgi:hypothetical protein